MMERMKEPMNACKDRLFTKNCCNQLQYFADSTFWMSDFHRPIGRNFTIKYSDARY